VIPSGLPEPISGHDVAVILHLSDTHFGTEDPAAVEALVTLTETEKPDVVVASGDITQRAREREFVRAQRFFNRLRSRHTLVLPGNHDIPLWDLPRRLLAPYASFRRYFGDNLEPRLLSDQVWIASLVSVRRWRHKDGALSLDQIERTAQWLLQAPRHALKVVVTHHPVAALRWHEEDDVLSGAPQALARWMEAGVDIVLGGHTHAPSTLPVRPAQAEHRTLWVSQAGSAVSRRVRSGSGQSVNLLRRHWAGAWRLEQWDFLPHRSEFARREWRELPLRPRAHAL
jgi:3',5'-cyclic AMP phosphodiesterase CpdA